jgi:glycosyltransferase involved in cell wall biosynthesis
MDDHRRSASADDRTWAAFAQLGCATSLRTLVLTSRQGKPPAEELRRAIAADLKPDGVSSDDAINATIIDERHIAAAHGLRGAMLRRLPLLAAQALEVVRLGGDHDAVVTWGERHSLMVALVMRLPVRLRRRPGHLAILVWPSKRNRALLRYVLRDVDRFIVYSPLQRLYVEQMLAVGRERLIDAKYSVDTRFWRPGEGAGDLICSVGMEMRDYGTLMESLRPLDIPCHIAAGQGMFEMRWRTAEWDENVGEKPIPDNITLGQKPHTELRDLYARSRFVVVPVTPSDQDNGITAILEAFAMGKAVVATENPGNTKILEHGVNCLLVPPYDVDAMRSAIVELWNDPERCERFGAAGRRVVEARHGLDQWTAGLVRGVEEASAEARARA